MNGFTPTSLYSLLRNNALELSYRTIYPWQSASLRMQHPQFSPCTLQGIIHRLHRYLKLLRRLLIGCACIDHHANLIFSFGELLQHGIAKLRCPLFLNHQRIRLIRLIRNSFKQGVICCPNRIRKILTAPHCRQHAVDNTTLRIREKRISSFVAISQYRTAKP